MLEDEAADRGVVFAEDGHHFLGIGGLGERGEAAQVEEDDGDLAPVALERIIGAAGDDQLGELGREEALEAADARQLVDAFRDALLERAIELGERAFLRTQLVVERLDAQQRAHPRQQLGLADRLAEEVVGAGVGGPWRAPRLDRAP